MLLSPTVMLKVVCPVKRRNFSSVVLDEEGGFLETKRTIG
ncbi:MAG: hypothetical protein Kow00107_07300 [Planctomycetota bacterium]